MSLGPGVVCASGGSEDVCRGSEQDPDRRPADEGQTGDHRLQDHKHETVRNLDTRPEPEPEMEVEAGLSLQLVQLVK